MNNKKSISSNSGYLQQNNTSHHLFPQGGLFLSLLPLGPLLRVCIDGGIFSLPSIIAVLRVFLFWGSLLSVNPVAAAAGGAIERCFFAGGGDMSSFCFNELLPISVSLASVDGEDGAGDSSVFELDTGGFAAITLRSTSLSPILDGVGFRTSVVGGRGDTTSFSASL